MSFVDAVKAGYSNYVNFEGRASRPEFWWFFLFVFVVSIVLSVFSDTLSFVFGLASLLPALGVSVRRLHDTGHSGWWVLLNLLNFILFAGFIILTIMSYARPSEGPNQYGPPAEGGPVPPPPGDDPTV